MSYLDSIDIQENIETLAQEIADHINYFKGKELDSDDVIEISSEELGKLCITNELVNMDDEINELYSLIKFKDEVCSSEWEYGITFIPDNEFTEYAMELLADCGDLSRDIPWYIEIDEEATANNIKVDYSSIEFEGTTYWYRA